MKLKDLNTKILGRNLIFYKKIDSTQLEIWRLAEQNLINGTIVVTDIQTNGKGTRGRNWYTNEENNIAVSFILHTNCNIRNLENITIEIAKTIIEVFKKLYNIELKIKYPNDIIFNDKKIGGILVETKISQEIVSELVIGIGLNTIQQKFPNEIKEIATSIKNEFDIEIDREIVIAEFCNLFEKILFDRKVI